MLKKLPSLTTPVVGSMSTNAIPPGAYTDAERLESMFDRAFSNSPQSEFLSSIYNWWEEKQFLTKGQFQGLAKFLQGARENELDFEDKDEDN